MVVSLLGILGLWVVVFYLWPDYRNDAFRDDIFNLRDEMFLYAAQGNISFDHPAYTRLRSRMNALLRHGNSLTLTRLLILHATCKDAKSEWFSAWETAMKELPEKTRMELEAFALRTTIFVLQHLIYNSFLRYLLVRPFMYFIKIRVVIETPKVKSNVERLESAALEEDALDEPALA
jgi:hypothetical protein